MSCIELWEDQGSQVIKIKMATRKSWSICSNLILMNGLDFCSLQLRSTFFNSMVGHYPCTIGPRVFGSRRNDHTTENTVSVNDAYASLLVRSLANTLSEFE